MLRLPTLALLGGLVVLSGGLVGQELKKQPATEAKKDPAKEAKAKGFLPQNWGKIGLSEDQKQNVYKVQAKYNSEIDQLEEKIKELKATRDREMKAVLTPDQKKRLEDLLLGKEK